MPQTYRKMIIAGLPGGGDKPLSGLKIVVDAGRVERHML